MRFRGKSVDFSLCALSLNSQRVVEVSKAEARPILQSMSQPRTGELRDSAPPLFQPLSVSRS